MTADQHAIAIASLEKWKRTEDTRFFRSELQRDLDKTLDSLVGKGNTPGVTLEELIRLAAKAKELKEILERL